MTLQDTQELTVLDALLDGAPLGLPATIRIPGSGDLVAVGLDNGNGHTKLAILTQTGDLVTHVVPTVYKTAKEIRGGAGIVTYSLDGGTPFWTGADALRYSGDMLPIGATPERVSDPRQRDFLAAALVEALLAAGYAPGIYNLAVGLAIPNAEIVLKKSADGDKLGVAKETRSAIREHLFGKTFEVTRTDEQGRPSHWTLTYTTIMPQAQSVGTYLAWSRRPDGTPVDHGVEGITIVDIGTGDMQRTDIDVEPYRMMSDPLGRGTIIMARQLQAQVPEFKLNEAKAMQALMSRTALDSGRRVDIGPAVDAIIAAEGQDMVARILPVLQQTERYVLFTGGGVLLGGLRSAIEERARAAGKRSPRNYAIVPETHAVTLNATGALLGVIYVAAGAGA